MAIPLLKGLLPDLLQHQIRSAVPVHRFTPDPVMIRAQIDLQPVPFRQGAVRIAEEDVMLLEIRPEVILLPEQLAEVTPVLLLVLDDRLAHF